MSFLQTAINQTKNIDGLNGIYQALNKLYNAESKLDVAAASSQLIAELMITTATTIALRTAMSTLRLGFAVSGQIWKWEASSYVAGVAGGAAAGSLIDWINEQKLGSKLYDALHPDEAAHDFFNRSRTYRYDPLVLDLDGDGIETVGGANQIYFDNNNDGIKTATGWVGADDGLLVMDRNGNGVIDNGTELFGNATQLDNGHSASDGFSALADLDSNHDGKIDKNDASWGQLKVWRDLNQDGISQANELFTLDQLGIASLNVNKESYNGALANGNQLTDQGTYTKTDGSTGNMGDVNFEEDAFHREFTDQVVIADNVKDLPDMQGAGKVRDLREAASLSTSLQDVLAHYSAATTREEQRGLLDQLLSDWADTSSMTHTLQERAGSTYTVIWKSLGDQSITDDAAGRAIVAAWEKKLHILEAFNGQYYFATIRNTLSQCAPSAQRTLDLSQVFDAHPLNDVAGIQNSLIRTIRNKVAA